MDIRPVDIRRAAMNLLARREHARGELIFKLKRRFGRVAVDADANVATSEDGTDGAVDLEQLILAEVDQLVSEGLQSDARLAESFIRARASRGQGPVKIKVELRNKGVSGDIIALALEECAIDWFAKAEEVANKRFGPGAPADAGERARRSRFLQQRGFSFDHISGVV